MIKKYNNYYHYKVDLYYRKTKEYMGFAFYLGKHTTPAFGKPKISWKKKMKPTLMCLQQPLLCSFQIDQDEKITYMYDQWN